MAILFKTKIARYKNYKFIQLQSKNFSQQYELGVSLDFSVFEES